MASDNLLTPRPEGDIVLPGDCTHSTSEVSDGPHPGGDALRILVLLLTVLNPMPCRRPTGRR